MGIRLPSHQPRLQGADATNWKKIKPLLIEGGLRPPVVIDIAQAIGNEPRNVESPSGSGGPTRAGRAHRQEPVLSAGDAAPIG